MSEELKFTDDKLQTVLTANELVSFANAFDQDDVVRLFWIRRLAKERLEQTERVARLEADKQALQQEVERLKPMLVLRDTEAEKDRDYIYKLETQYDAERQRAEVAELALEFAIRHPGTHIEMAKAEAHQQLERSAGDEPKKGIAE